MNLISKLFMAILIPAGLACGAWADFAGKLVAVKDGDTLEVLRGGTNAVRVRLSKIDCPEKSQAFGQREKKDKKMIATESQMFYIFVRYDFKCLLYQLDRD